MVSFNYKWFGFLIFSGGLDYYLHNDDTKIKDDAALLNKNKLIKFSLDEIQKSERNFICKYEFKFMQKTMNLLLLIIHQPERGKYI